MKFRRIWDSLSLVGEESRNVVGILEHQIHGLVQQQGPQHAAQCGEQVGDFEFDRPRFDFSGFHFRQVEQVVHEFQQILRGPADVSTCCSCSDRESPSDRSQQQAAKAPDIEFSGERNSWLMLERNFDFNSSARRRWSAFSSSSA